MNAALLVQLQSKLSHERLTAARILNSSARHEDITEIQKAIAQETVPWVKKALERTLNRLVPNSAIVQQLGFNLESFSDVVTRDIALKMGDQIASAIVHEIYPKLGYIRNSASKEIVDFENSETLKKINFLEKLLILIGEFRKVSKTPTLIEFELSDLIATICDEHSQEYPLLQAGPKTTVVYGEPTRIDLAVSNGLRNAIDASILIDPEKKNSITITWGITDTEHWISIVDSGIGLVGSLSGMFSIGSSNKSGDHFGMGLPLARQAMNSLGGDVQLSPGANGGARFEIKWPRINERLKENN